VKRPSDHSHIATHGIQQSENAKSVTAADTSQLFPSSWFKYQDITSHSVKFLPLTHTIQWAA